MKTSVLTFYSTSQIKQLSEKGVIIPDSETVRITSDVFADNISTGCTLHPFSRISGSETQIKTGAQIGVSGAATLENSWVGENAQIGTLGPVTLKKTVVGPNSILGSGVAEQAVFLGKESMCNDFSTGYGFRVRKGTLYEEDASSAQHTDTKMTILFPWATLGSNINFCDVLLAGGTGAELGNFSEVGSGTIHFNFSIRGDKATASMFGDVNHGLFLDQKRLFVGGNNSLLGPIQADFGCMTAAGARINGSVAAGLNFGHVLPRGKIAYDPNVFMGATSIFKKQIHFIAELTVLYHWYQQVRIACIAKTIDQKYIYESGLSMILLNYKERLAQLKRYVSYLEDSMNILEKNNYSNKIEYTEQKKILTSWDKIENTLQAPIMDVPTIPKALKDEIQKLNSTPLAYTQLIQMLPIKAKDEGKIWLKSISDQVNETLLNLL